MTMPASAFEFRNRFWIIGGLFGLGFSCYWVDRDNAAAALVSLLGLGPGTAAWPRSLQGVFLVAAALCAAAAMLRTWGNAYLRSEVVRDAAIHAERLVRGGPFRHVRNPLYLANVLLAAGLGLMASRLGWLVLAAGMLLFVLRLIGREEASLGAAQGEGYRAYCAAVPRLWPSLRPRVPAGPDPWPGGAVPAGAAQPRWAQAWAGEAWMWGFAIATAAFAVTGNLRLFWILMAVSTAVYLVLLPLWRRRARALSGSSGSR